MPDFFAKENAGDVIADSQLELSRREHRLILSTWNAVRQDLRFPSLFLARFLSDQPGRPVSSQSAQTAEFSARISTIMDSLDVIVQSLNSRARLNEELRRIGSDHYRRGVSVNMFRLFIRTVVVAIEELMGDEFTIEDRAAWDRGIAFFLANVALLYSLHIVPGPLFTLDEI